MRISMLPDPTGNGGGRIGGNGGIIPMPAHVPSGTQIHVCLTGTSGKYGIGAGKGCDGTGTG